MTDSTPATEPAADTRSPRERARDRIRELSAFTPDWLQSTEPLHIRGTVSRVELPFDPVRQMARLYFKESPDAAFVACMSPLGFPDLRGYIGKHVEVRGRVVQSNCGGRVANVLVTDRGLIFDLDRGLPPDEAPLPGTTAPAPETGEESLPGPVPRPEAEEELDADSVFAKLKSLKGNSQEE